MNIRSLLTGALWRVVKQKSGQPQPQPQDCGLLALALPRTSASLTGTEHNPLRAVTRLVSSL